jgi:hypothetical protein
VPCFAAPSSGGTYFVENFAQGDTEFASFGGNAKQGMLRIYKAVRNIDKKKRTR